MELVLPVVLVAAVCGLVWLGERFLKQIRKRRSSRSDRAKRGQSAREVLTMMGESPRHRHRSRSRTHSSDEEESIPSLRPRRTPPPRDPPPPDAAPPDLPPVADPIKTEVPPADPV